MHVIATAGHVDHGKSTLVRALTGMEPDRWAEERRRGMTIDLGYAWTTLGGGEEIAFVDVPGHHRFITNMLAGVGPVPAVLLVVAADEGWSRQTAEHVAALDALGVRHGVLAVTRADLGDADLAAEEAHLMLAGTSLAGIEAVAVSPVAGTGLDELRAALARLVAGLPTPTSTASRLWVDRVFVVRGAGTVVTGTLGSGALAVGDTLVVSSSGEQVQVRGLESLRRTATRVDAVARVAVNLRNVKTSQIVRGDALHTPGRWTGVTVVDARVIDPPAQLPTHLTVHVGSAAVAARVRPLGADTVRLAWATPLPIHVGERMILRDPGAQQVVAGVVVLDVDPPPLRRRGAAAARAEQLAAMDGSADPVGEVGRRGVVRRSALVAAGVLVPEGAPVGDAVEIGDWLVDPGQWQRWREAAVTVADTWARDHVLQPGIAPSTLVQELGLPGPALVDPLVRATPELVIDRDGVHRAGVHAALPQTAQASLERLVERLRDDPFAAPEADELASAGLTEQHLAVAVRQGRLLRVSAAVYLLPDAVQRAAHLLRELPQPFTLSEARQAMRTTRRVAVPVLELLDRELVTERVDEQRRVVRT